MASGGEEFTLGVEEEYQIVGSETRALRPRVERILKRAEQTLGEDVHPELHASQIEMSTPVCRTLADVRDQVTRSRRALIEAAAPSGNAIAAAGTHPFSHWEDQPITPETRYQGIAAHYQQLAQELVIFGCHVHVGLGDRDAAIGVLNRTRVWLAPLLALSANSPFWLGADTGYASFRTELWGRWPMAGQPLMFASRDEYDDLIAALIATGTIEDASKIYWDVRLPERIPTVEFRVTDVCLTIDEAVMVAGLARGLVRTAFEQTLRDEPFPAARPELLKAAHWRAARYGLSGELIDVGAQRALPAHELVGSLLQFVRPALEAFGDWEQVSDLVQRTVEQGTGAARQRAVYERTGRWEAVVDYIVAQTAQGSGADPAAL